jgi:two-component system sensor histidine kinase QseC
MMQAATRWFSLRRRLLALLLGGVTAAWCAMLVFTYRDAHHEIDELFDAQLVQAAQTLLAMAGEYEDDDDVAELDGHGHKYQKHIVFQLWDIHGRLLLRSRQAPTAPLAARDGFSDGRLDGADGWRFYSQWDRERQLRVQVGENHRVREKLIMRIAGRLLVPALFGLPLIGVWVWFATRRGLAPIDAVAEQVANRAPEHLAPLAPAVAPEEIRPLLDALNDLFARVERTLDAERRFTADAAHELRTPLAALAAQAQVAQRARDAAEREHALAQIGASSRRATRLVDQLLTLARLDPSAGVAMETVALDTLAAEVCADHGVAALEKDIALELDVPAGMLVRGNADLLRILLRNLVDNAVRYTPANGGIAVRVGAAGQGEVELSVADSGSGIPAEQRENALRRFQRLAGQEIEGSGLGLSIAARIAELHGARLELGDGIGAPGLAVRLRLKAA